MTAAPDRIGGQSEYDRAVAFAKGVGVRVVETTWDWLIDTYGVAATAVCITRRGGLSLRGISTPHRGGLEPGESRIYLTETRHGDALAVLHEAGHAVLHADGPHRRGMTTEAIIQQELEAWRYALDALGREPTPEERQEITRVLMKYGAGMKEIRTHVLLTN